VSEASAPASRSRIETTQLPLPIHRLNPSSTRNRLQPHRSLRPAPEICNSTHRIRSEAPSRGRILKPSIRLSVLSSTVIRSPHRRTQFQISQDALVQICAKSGSIKPRSNSPLGNLNASATPPSTWLFRIDPAQPARGGFGAQPTMFASLLDSIKLAEKTANEPLAEVPKRFRRRPTSLDLQC